MRAVALQSGRADAIFSVNAVLAYLAGHRDMSITKRYVHPQEHNTRTAMEKARVALSGYNSGHSAILSTDGQIANPPVSN